MGKQWSDQLRSRRGGESEEARNWRAGASAPHVLTPCPQTSSPAPGNTMKRRRFLEAAGSTSLLSLLRRPADGVLGRHDHAARAPGGCRLAVARAVGRAQRQGRRTVDQGPAAPGSVRGRAGRRGLRRRPAQPAQSVFHRRAACRHADVRLGRRLAVVAQRVRGGREEDGRRRGRRGLRAHAQPARRRERRRAQLPGHVERAGLAADLDAADGRHHAARGVHARRLRGQGESDPRPCRCRRARAGCRSTTR